MELIPILSLIILVSTISTFILAVGAYILYKIRERKGAHAKAKPPETIPAELVEPAQSLTEPRITRTGEFVTGDRFTRGERFTEGTRGGFFQSTYDDKRQGAPAGYTRPTFVTKPTGTYTEDYYKRKSPETMESEKYTGRNRKFLRYTGEVEEEAPREKKNKEDNLQWR